MSLAEWLTPGLAAGVPRGSLLECSQSPANKGATSSRQDGERVGSGVCAFSAAHNALHQNRSCALAGHPVQSACTLFVQKGKNMKQPNDVLNDIQQKMSEFLKNSPAKDVERNVKAVLSQGFSKLDLVTREEFDTQTQVLIRTRARLEELEKRVAELEQKLGSGKASGPTLSQD
jgi:ubiquinone biosynthesis accessory factor UbiK